ncbi:hypothetical protein HDV04_005842 [Boothiomyces sp. JEL0838]|nr:hypothetical protein HDV04_005842 [Boothiomyces sp. JEL0838]
MEPLEIKSSSHRTPFISKKPTTQEATRAKYTPTLPSLGPLKINMAIPASPKLSSNLERKSSLTALHSNSLDSTHAFIQHTWSTFSTLSDADRNQLLKGLLSRSNSKQIEYICTCLNIKSMESGCVQNSLPTKVFPPDVLDKYLVRGGGGKPTNYHVKDKEASNLSEMDPEAITRQAAKAGPEGIRFLMLFLSKQCQKFQTVIKSLIDISLEVELEKAAKRLFKLMLSVTDAKHGTIYVANGNKFQIYVSNWPEKRAKEVSDSQIFALKTILTGEVVNVYNFRTSDYHNVTLEQVYQSLDPDCVISAPFFGDGMKVTGLIELINKNSGNPFFNAEDEFLVQSLASLTTILFNQINVKQTASKKSDEIKTFLTTTNNMTKKDVDMGDLIGVIMQTARELVNADRCALFLWDKDENMLWSKVAQDSEEIKFPANKGIAGYVVNSGVPLNIEDAYADSRFNPEFDAKTGYRTKTILCVPMVTEDGEIVGAVQAINKKPLTETFVEDDTQQLMSFASLVSELEATNFYNKCVSQTLHGSLLTLNETGRMVSIENANLLKIQDLIPTMRLTSYEHWLGKDNSSLVDDIAKTMVSGLPITVHNYLFTVMGVDNRPLQKVSVSYHIRKLKGSTDNLNGSFLSSAATPLSRRRVSSIRKSSTTRNKSLSKMQVPFGIMLFIELVTPNRLIIEQLGYQIPHNKLQALLDNQDKLDGESQPVTTLAIDIRRFSSLITHLTPSKATSLLNKYNDIILRVLKSHGGTLIEVSASLVIAAFGAPYKSNNDVINSINASLDIQKGIEELNKKSEETAFPPIYISVGISTGECICAAIGSAQLKKYSVLGAPVELAIQMSYLATVYGANIVVCDSTREVIKEYYHIREVDVVTRRDIKENITISETVICFELGLQEYRAKNWQAAIMHFKKALTLTDDMPSKYMIERCRGLIDGRYELPDEWDGVWTL